MPGLMSALVLCAVAATLVAALALAAEAIVRRPAVAHALWLLVLLKLLVPPFVAPRIPHLSDALAWLAGSGAEPEAARAEPLADAPRPAASPATSAACGAAMASAAPRSVPETPTPALDTLGPDPHASETPPPLAPDDPPLPPAAPDSARGAAHAIDPAPTTPFPWPAALAAVWCLGSIAWFGLALARALRFRALAAGAAPAPEPLRRLTREVAGRLGLRRAPDVRILDAPIPPALWTFAGRPTIVLPAGLLETLSDAERATLLAHEMAHLIRRDHWVRRIELIVLGIYWWHPVAWLACRRLRAAEERGCDAWVVWAFPAAARDYARAIVKTLDILANRREIVPVGATPLVPVRFLERRIQMILSPASGASPSRTWVHRLAMLSAAALILPLAPAVRAKDPAQTEAAKAPAAVEAGAENAERGFFLVVAAARESLDVARQCLAKGMLAQANAAAAEAVAMAPEADLAAEAETIYDEAQRRLKMGGPAKETAWTTELVSAETEGDEDAPRIVPSPRRVGVQAQPGAEDRLQRLEQAMKKLADEVSRLRAQLQAQADRAAADRNAANKAEALASQMKKSMERYAGQPAVTSHVTEELLQALQKANPPLSPAQREAIVKALQGQDRILALESRRVAEKAAEARAREGEEGARRKDIEAAERAREMQAKALRDAQAAEYRERELAKMIVADEMQVKALRDARAAERRARELAPPAVSPAPPIPAVPHLPKEAYAGAAQAYAESRPATATVIVGAEPPAKERISADRKGMRFVVGEGGTSVIAMRTQGGQLVWKVNVSQPVVGSPMPDESGRVLLTLADGSIAVLDAKTGKLLMEMSVPKSPPAIPQPPRSESQLSPRR
jgi:beta-lactamase regulating signal transducer with metallopeptidase domain